jgi:hypothetical protein
MPIPDDQTLQSDLLEFLADEPDHRATVWRVYEQLALKHPEVTEAEKSEKYQNSASLWANRVQFARLHLANSGLLYRANAAPDAPRSYWKLTAKGVEQARSAAKPEQQESQASILLPQVAADLDALVGEESALEGQRSERLVAHFERNPKLRALAIAIHGTTCVGCGFNFAKAYGPHGLSYIEVHHLVPVSRMTQPSSVNPKTDMAVLCSNCHRMVHRKQDAPLSIAELVALVQRANRNDA